MKKLILLTILFLISTYKNYGQEYFEGEINYKIKYQPINPNIPEEYLVTQFGDTFTAYVKEDRYAMIYHATGEQGWMKTIVRLDQGYSYMEFEKSDTIFKKKFGTENDELIEVKKNTEDTKIVLGKLCESVTISYKPTDPEAFYQIYNGTYYFDPRYKLNVELYKNHTDGFWNLYVEEAESISIRNETEFSPLFKAIQEATSITKKEIQSSIFEPNGSKIIYEE